MLLQRVALISGENAPDADVAEVIQDVMEWLSTQSDDLSSVSLCYVGFVLCNGSAEQAVVGATLWLPWVASNARGASPS